MALVLGKASKVGDSHTHALPRVPKHSLGYPCQDPVKRFVERLEPVSEYSVGDKPEMRRTFPWPIDLIQN